MIPGLGGLAVLAVLAAAPPPSDAPTVESLRQQIDQLSADLRALEEGKPLPPPQQPTPSPPPGSETAQKPKPSPVDKADTSDFQPVRVEDAKPLEHGVEASLSLLNVDERGKSELRFVPTVLTSTPWPLELGVSGPFAIKSGDVKWATSASAHAISGITKAEGKRPALSLRADVLFPAGDSGAGAAVTALATEKLGEYRVHGNAQYQAVHSGTSSWFGGLAADRSIGEKVLLAADAWYQRYLGEHEGTVAGSVGGIYRFTDAFSVYGSAGVQSAGGEFDPRLLIGVSANP